MAITTKRDGRTMVRVRYRKGTCVRGEDYGPEHRDEPVDVPLPMARLHVEHLGRAEYVEEGGGEVELPFQPGEVTVADLPEVLAGVEDPEVIARLQAADDRSTAQDHYEARAEELEG